jgi:general secretion pathway protein L
MARRILALDIGAYSLKAAIVESTLRRSRVLGLFQQRRDPERALVDQLQEFRTAHALHADTTLSCLPGDAVSLRFLELPFTRPRQLEQTVPFELSSQLPFAPDAVVADFHIIQRTGDGSTILTVATPKITLTEHLAMLAAAGFNPTSVNVAALPPLTLLRFAGVDLSGSTALLDIGVDRTTVLLLRDGVLQGLRTLSIGLNRIGGFPAFMRDIHWTILAFGGDAGALPERFFLCGGGSRISRLREELAQALATDVIPFHELSLPLMPETQRQEQGVYAVCLGLGLREALGLTTPAVNLRQGMFVHQGHRETVRKEISRLAWLAAGAVAAAGLTFGLEMYRLNTQYEALRQEIRQVFTATVPEIQTIVSEKVQLQDALETLHARQRLLQGTTTASPLELLRQLSAAMPDHVSLDLDEWTFDTDSIRLKGSTTSFDAAETIKATASGLGVFKDVQLKDVKTATSGKKVSFGLQLTLNQKTVGSQQ